MPIVCGVDFSPASEAAAVIAGRLASRWGTSVVLAHAVDVEDHPVYGKLKKELIAAAQLALDKETDGLRTTGATAEEVLLTGKADEALVRLATERGAQAIVISALGTRKASEWQLGGSADRIAQLATCPVLVIRDPEPLSAWLDGRKPLRVLLGLDRTRVSEDALRFVGALRKAAPVDLTALHLYWAADEYRRLGFGGIRSLVEADPELERILQRELEAEVGQLPGEGRRDLRVELCLGRASDRINAIAESMGAELIVVGSHRRNLLDRLWNGSTSREVLRRAHASVACVTAAPGAEEEKPIRQIQSVLVATDFSPTGDAAVRWAYGLVPASGVVHLMTVLAPTSTPGPLQPRDLFDGPFSPEDAAAMQQAERALLLREPEAARGRGITTRVRAISSSHVADAIVQAAERLGVDAIVLGTHGRSGMVRAVLGSVAQEVGAKSGRAVLLVHPAAA